MKPDHKRILKMLSTEGACSARAVGERLSPEAVRPQDWARRRLDDLADAGRVIRAQAMQAGDPVLWQISAEGRAALKAR